ncbi:signal peptidase I [Faecalicatena contorta]|uniref:Signal peptidase I n=1 Tax=Faecalicatena fissicatena TaxID=290055 RepID=A0ABS2E7S8_9FIRM|nr:MULTISPECIES: signal peptidase I [Clostridia]MBM6684373.1 signal peptidase I [Faecalicatena contorta]MBM6709315.1 signal peptidase I [Faecalicatena contorta]MBM6737684.1 signal peptidase I [Faecalicatena fissicatena]
MRGLKFRRRRRRRNKFRIEMLRPVAVWAGKIAIVCLFAFVFVWYFGQRVAVVGDSMNPILNNGDIALVNRIVYDATAPKRGDIIVFKPKGNENSHYYIKRIIGLPGEKVQILEGEIYIDGEKLEEDYGVSEITDPGIAAEEIELEGNEFFVLGDDRENSEDSRMADVGNVKRSYIYGKAWFVISPWENFGFVRS